MDYKIKRNTGKLTEILRKIKKNLLILLVTTSIVTFIELSYGSKYLGTIFLIVTIFILIFLKKEIKKEKNNKKILMSKSIFLGVLIIFSVILYNVFFSYPKLNFQTLDIMVMIFGASVILSSLNKYSDIGNFLYYFSLLFILMFLLLFVIPNKLNIDIPYYYGKYAIIIPVLYISQHIGIKANLIGNRIIELEGIQHVVLKIDLACFGWYSLLLIISMVISYGITMKNLTKTYIIKIIAVLSLASYLANILRILILLHVAQKHGIDKMLIIHAHLGWILFIIILIPISYIFLKKNST